MVGRLHPPSTVWHRPGWNYANCSTKQQGTAAGTNTAAMYMYIYTYVQSVDEDHTWQHNVRHSRLVVGPILPMLP